MAGTAFEVLARARTVHDDNQHDDGSQPMMKVLAPLALLALLAGCLVSERPYDSLFDDDRFGLPTSFSNYANDGLRPVRGHLAGDIGPSMRGMDEAAMLNGYHDDGYTNLEVIVTNEGGAAMAMLEFHGGLVHQDLQPGTELSFVSGSAARSDTSRLHIGGIACSGDGQAYNWSYDEPFSQVDVRVLETEDPNIMRLDFTTHHGGDTADGFIDVALGDR